LIDATLGIGSAWVTNVRLGLKSYQWTNRTTYFAALSETKKKSFVILTLGRGACSENASQEKNRMPPSTKKSVSWNHFQREFGLREGPREG